MPVARHDDDDDDDNVRVRVFNSSVGGSMFRVTVTLQEMESLT